jgi:hypothetical protein
MASGDTLYVFTAQDNEPPASLFATPDTRNSRPCLDFVDGSDTSAVFSGIMPQSYSSTTGVTIRIVMGSTTDQTSGTVAWECLFERVINDSTNLDADSFVASAAGNRFTQNAPAGASQPAIDSVAITDGANMDFVVAGDPFRLKITRDGDGTSQTDSMTGDAELYSVEIQET